MTKQVFSVSLTNNGISSGMDLDQIPETSNSRDQLRDVSNANIEVDIDIAVASSSQMIEPLRNHESLDSPPCFTIEDDDSSAVNVTSSTELTSISIVETASNALDTSSTAGDSYKSIQRFFLEQSRIASTLPIDQIELKSSAFLAILRPYQRETVQWMLMREMKPTCIRVGAWDIELPRGGILADEMGLGKTVEVLACILGNPKQEVESVNVLKNTIDSVSGSEKTPPQSLLGKRPSKTKPTFLKKKPHLSKIKQNATLKKEIKSLLKEYFTKFQRKVLQKRKNVLNAECLRVAEDSFNVLLLHKYYNSVDIEFAKQQTWGYLISEFDAHEENTLGYSILLKESLKNGQTLPEGSLLSDDNATIIINLLKEFLTDKILENFKKEFYLKIRLSINLTANEFIPLLENEDVRCRCGSDKAKGRKIRCLKCGSYQHRECVGLSDDVENYCCPSCWMNEPPIESAATLIVIPDTLTQQWMDEIKKHAADCNLKIFWYRGVVKGYILPSILSTYDIILITSYTLGGDLSFVNTSNRSLRHVKRYQPFITPLTCIRWWRLCIDEAQTVEGVNRVSEMASRLQTEHLWAVTGTPVGKSLRDLCRLAIYLRMKPFVESDACWKELISGDQSLLHLLFAHLMRRKTKVEVNNQLKLPDLTYDTKFLSFPPIEGYFYNATHIASQKLFLQKISNIKDLQQPLKKAYRHTVESVLAPLLSLRQACVNPEAVCTMNLFNLRKNETMHNLLEKMIKKTKVDCEDILRLYIMLVNGSARLHIQADKMVDAVTLYRSVLTKLSIYVDLKADDFQLIHIMHNLYEAANRDPTIELTDDEKAFPQKIIEIETKCLDKLQDELLNMKIQLSKYTTEITNYVESFGLKEYSWWEKMLHTFNYVDVITRINEDLHRDHIEVTGSLKLKLSTPRRLGEALKYWLADVEQKRSLTFIYLEQITSVTSREALWTAADNCHLRNSDPKRTCLICRMEELMRKYETLLFNTGDQDANEDGTVESNWKHTVLECALHVLLSCSRTTSAKIDNTSAGHQLKALSLLKREFRAIRAIWTKQCDLLHVFDEIRMAKSTLESETGHSDLLQPGTSTFEHEVETFQAQSTSSYLILQTKYGSLQYLKNLEKRYNSAENVEETCPVCHMSMDEKRAVMTCGHFTCYTCMQALMERCNRLHILCPVCRTSVPLSSISYVYGGGSSDLDVSNVVGNYSIKILAIIAKVLELTADDPTVKILVFSTWDQILNTIERALRQNNIACLKYTTGEKRRTSLATFKTDENINVLLIPLKSGSKGLNLTEASHIIFAEPVLNMADEKQAIGRIYRLGQQRSMVVHKFIIRSSVEEHLHKMTEELQQNSDNNECELTFQHLRDLFRASAANLTEM